MTKQIDALHKLVDDAILNQEREVRDYLGASLIGTECDRQLWYSYHEPLPVSSARVLRIYDVGHALETLMIKWLELAGLKLFTVDSNGKQFRFTEISETGKKVSGGCDGVSLGIPFDEKTPHLIELKTANDFRWKAFVKDGFCSDEKYKAQIHLYMLKFKLKKCLAVVLNKNTQEMYYEIIDFDEFEAQTALNRGKAIVEMSEMPDRKYPSRSFFKCNFCDYKERCWK